LLVKQAESWLNNQNKGIQKSAINIEETKKEIAKLKDQEDRYAKAYGAGAITLDQFKEYTIPLKDKAFSFNNQIIKAELEGERAGEKTLPPLKDIKIFSEKASQKINNLNFNEKKAIVRSIIDKVVGVREELQVCGYIPITSNINVCTSDRNCGLAERREIDAF